MALATLGCYGQPVYVSPPSVVPLPYGLFSVSEIVEDNTAHWQQGVEWERHRGCQTALRYACPTCAQNDGGTAPAKTYGSGVALVQAAAFTVYGSFSCSPVGNWDLAYERARESLLNGEERAVEAEIAVGGFHASNTFNAATSVDITPTPGTAVNMVSGIALLENYLGINNHGQGVLHMSRREATFAIADRLTNDDVPGKLVTKLGTPIAAGAGYTGGFGPNNVAATGANHWIYATGIPYIRRSAVWMQPPSREQALSQRTNDLKVLAERTYAINWDCVTAAVLVATV